MKTFKRALSCFLALLMIFGSFSVLSNAAFGDGSRKSVIVETKFFVDGEEVTEVKAGDTVKVRIYVATDFVAATTTLFYVYPKDFMEFDNTGLTSLGGNGWAAAGVFNKSATSSAVTNNLDGLFNHEVGVVIDSESDADNLIYYGYINEEYFDDKGWISFTVNKGTPVQYSIDNENGNTEDDHLAEFTFKVKDDAIGEGYFHVLAESIKTPSAKNAFSAVMRASSDTAFTVASADNARRLLYDVALNDTNTIKLASGEVTPTTYEVKYEYAGDIPTGYTAPVAIQLAEGEAIEEPEVTIPEGYTLTWTGIPEGGKMGTAPVTLTGTWAKKSNTVTYVYAGETPDGKTAPEAITLKYGEAITEPTVEIPEGYTLTWSGIPEDGKMGTAPVTLTGTWAKKSNTVTYVYAGEKPDGAKEPEAITLKYGEAITEPTVEIPEGYTLTWTGIPESGKMGLEAVTLTGTWAKKSYTITYYLSEQDKADGKVYTTETVKFGAALPVVTPNVEGMSFNHWDYETEAGGLADEIETMPAYNLVAVANLSEIIYTVTFTDVWGDEVTVQKNYGEALTEDDLPDLTEGGAINAVFTYNDKPLAEQLPLALTDDITIDCVYNVTATFYTVYDEENPENNVVHKTYTFDFEYETTEDDFADLGAPYKKGHGLDADLPWTYEYIGQTMSENTYFVANFVPNNYDASFMVDGEVYDTKNVTFGEEIALPATAPELEGYTFKGWTDVEGGAALDKLVMDDEGKTFYPVFVENGKAGYTVEIYLMDTTGAYGAHKTEAGSATIGTSVTVAHADYAQDAWFSADGTAANEYTAVVAENGSTVLKLYYKRAQYDVVIDGAAAVPVYHGAEITAPETSTATPAGYVLESWNDGAYAKGDVITVTGPLTLAPKFAAGTSEYTINTYEMGLDGEYGAAVPATKTATTDSTVTYTAPVIEGFKADKESYSVKVTGDGKAVIDVYYVRDKYDVTIDGTTTQVFYGAEITAPTEFANTPAGYVLESWNDGAIALGATVKVTGPLTLAPKFAAGTSEYTINTYEMGLDGEYGAAVPATKTATTDSTVTYTAPVIEGFKADKDSYSVVVTGDGKAVINVYYARNTYEVVIDGETTTAYYGATIKAPTEADAEAGYHLVSWNGGTVAMGQEITVTGPVTLTPDYEANTDTAYTVEIYLMDENGDYAETPDDTDALTGTTDTKATAAHADYAQEAWFTPAATGNVTEATITGDGKAVLKLYFERAQYDVTIDGVATKVYHGATINAPATTTQSAPAGYAFAGWNNGTIAAGAPITVTEAMELVPYFAEGAATYTVEIYLQNADGTYAEAASDTKTVTGTTGDDVTIAHADYAQDAKCYVADDAAANVFEGTIAGDGSLKLKLYFKRATYTVAYEYEDGTAIGTATEVRYGAAITAPAYDSPDGMNFIGWFDKETNETMPATMPAKNATYVVKFAAGDAIPYTIAIHMMDVNGEYVVTESQLTGTTGSPVSVVPNYSYTGFTVNTEKSNLNDTIAGDGSTVLAVYYDRNLYKATFDGVEYQVYYGASLPTVEPAAQEGKEFDAWTPAVPATMPAEDLEFTSTWKIVKYKLIYFINGEKEVYEYAVGETVTPIENPSVPGMTFSGWNGTIPDVMPAEDVIIVAKFEAAVFKVTFVDGDGNVFDEKAVKYGDAIVLPVAKPTKEYHVFKGWLDVPATMPAKDITIYPEFERVPVRLVAAEGSTTIIDRETMIITGLTTKMNDAKKDKYLAVEGDGYYTITPAEGYEGYDCYGTGAVVKVYDNADASAPIEEFYIVIYGDVNGDSAVNSLDGSIIEAETLYETNWSRGDSKDILMVMAADLNKDGKIKPNDKDSVINTSIGITKIDQVTGTVSR